MIEEGINNEEEIKENNEFYLNNKKIDFFYKYKFPKDGKYNNQIIIKNPLSNTNYMFFNFNKLLHQIYQIWILIILIIWSIYSIIVHLLLL